MKPATLLVVLALAAVPLSATGVGALAACPSWPCEPEPEQVNGPVNHFFGVTIKQDIPNTVPQIQGTLMNGCTFTAVTNHGTVSCSPVTPPAPNTYWTCDSPGLIATATTGTVKGTTQCEGSDPVVAKASTPGNGWEWQILVGTGWGFPWTCIADFTSPLATGNVLCDEPDPPVQFW